VEATSLSTLTLWNAIVKPPEPLVAVFSLLFLPALPELIELGAMNRSPMMSPISLRTRLRPPLLGFIGLTKSAQHDDGDVFYEHVGFKSPKNIESR